MHYENGHEVATQLAREVHSIAFSQTKVWTRRESPEETYICQLGGMIALKLHAVMDCSPDTLLNILQARQMEWDMNLRSTEILEEYDHFNQIKMQRYMMPIASKIVYMCLYTCIIATQPNHYILVYQSIDHERIPPYEDVVTVYPSGFFVSPIPGDIHKCHITSIFQFQSEYPQNSKVVTHLCTSSERIVAGIRGVLARSIGGEVSDRWENIMNILRKDMYHTMHALDPSNGWSLRFQRAGMRTFSKQNAQEFRVATRTAFTLPYKCHDVAAALFEACSKGVEWDQFVEHIDEPKYLGPTTFIQGITWCDLQEGTTRRGYMLVHLNSIRDNTCDVTCKISFTTPPVTFSGWLHTFMASGGFIIHPSEDPQNSTIQTLMDNPYPTPCSDESMKLESLRIHHYLNALVGYMTKLLRENVREGSLRETPVPPMMELPRHEMPYATVMDAFSKLLMDEPSIYRGPPESPRSSRLEPFYRTPQSKRKHLMNVDDVIFSHPRNMVTARKPFLFLVSDDGSAHRFLRRRLESPIGHSKFDTLPQEIIIEIFKFLGSNALNNVACTCTHFKDLVINCQLWRNLYSSVWGEVRGRVARRYCGDDDPIAFFSTFSDWKELYLEKQYIEDAWDAPERRALSFTVTKAHARSVKSMALLPYKHRLVTGSQDRLVRVWDVTSGACLVKLHGTAACVSVTPWNDTIVKVGYKDGTVHVFDAVREQCTSETHVGEPMHGCLFSNNSMISWHELTVTHWDETTNQRLATFAGHLQRIKSCALSSTKSILYTASRDTTVRLWDVHNRSKIGSIDGHTRAVNTIELIGENFCLTGSSDKLVKVWDLRKLDTAVQVLSAHTGKLICMKHSDIGNKLCTGGEDGVHIWNSTTFAHIRKDFEGEFVTSLALDEESIAYGGLNGQIQYFDFSPHR